MYERLELMLISAEVVILFAIVLYLQGGDMDGRKSLAILFSDKGWVIGFLGFGPLIPFALKLLGVLRGWRSAAPIVLSSALVLMGGYLLRHYFMIAGVYAYPW